MAQHLSQQPIVKPMYVAEHLVGRDDVLGGLPIPLKDAIPNSWVALDFPVIMGAIEALRLARDIVQIEPHRLIDNDPDATGDVLNNPIGSDCVHIGLRATPEHERITSEF